MSKVGSRAPETVSPWAAIRTVVPPEPDADGDGVGVSFAPKHFTALERDGLITVQQLLEAPTETVRSALVQSGVGEASAQALADALKAHVGALPLAAELCEPNSVVPGHLLRNSHYAKPGATYRRESLPVEAYEAVGVPPAAREALEATALVGLETTDPEPEASTATLEQLRVIEARQYVSPQDLEALWALFEVEPVKAPADAIDLGPFDPLLEVRYQTPFERTKGGGVSIDNLPLPVQPWAKDVVRLAALTANTTPDNSTELLFDGLGKRVREPTVLTAEAIRLATSQTASAFMVAGQDDPDEMRPRLRGALRKAPGLHLEKAEARLDVSPPGSRRIPIDCDAPVDGIRLWLEVEESYQVDNRWHGARLEANQHPWVAGELPEGVHALLVKPDGRWFHLGEGSGDRVSCLALQSGPTRVQFFKDGAPVGDTAFDLRLPDASSVDLTDYAGFGLWSDGSPLLLELEPVDEIQRELLPERADAQLGTFRRAPDDVSRDEALASQRVIFEHTPFHVPGTWHLRSESAETELYVHVFPSGLVHAEILDPEGHLYGPFRLTPQIPSSGPSESDEPLLLSTTDEEVQPDCRAWRGRPSWSGYSESTVALSFDRTENRFELQLVAEDDEDHEPHRLAVFSWPDARLVTESE